MPRPMMAIIGWGAQGGCPLRAPTDIPARRDTQLTHPVPQAAASPHGRVCRATHPLAIGCRFGHPDSKFKALAVLPNNRPATRRPFRLPPWSPSALHPPLARISHQFRRAAAALISGEKCGLGGLPRYYESAATSDRSSRRTSFPSFGPNVHRDRRLSFRYHGRQTPSARGPGRWFSRFTLGPLSGVETTGPPTFLGNPSCLCPALRPRQDQRTRP